MIHQASTQRQPLTYSALKEASAENNFPMSSESLTCSLLRTLAASKPGGRFLELGTGTGLSASWLLDGMDEKSELISVDNDPEVQAIANEYLKDTRLTLINTDGNKWISANGSKKFDFIFADAWPGKYQMLNETLSMLKKGGIYFIDDMLPQSNWPLGHQEKVNQLLKDLDNREDIVVTRQNWASGVVICTKL